MKEYTVNACQRMWKKLNVVYFIFRILMFIQLHVNRITVYRGEPPGLMIVQIDICTIDESIIIKIVLRVCSSRIIRSGGHNRRKVKGVQYKGRLIGIQVSLGAFKQRTKHVCMFV